MSNISFNMEINFEYLVANQVSPNVRRMVASNANAMTYKGTNTYIVGKGNVAVIDPGPEIAEHRDALLEELGNEKITHILLTHTHMDHSAGLAALKEATGAITLGYGARDQSKRPPKQDKEDKEFIDWDFVPDQIMQDGDVLDGEGWSLKALHTPGHAPDHLCFSLLEDEILLSGDHVMAWNTSVVAPPEGHMGDYMASLEKLLKQEEHTFFPGHGGRVSRPQRVVKAYLVHRTWREAAILNCIKEGNETVPQIVKRVYPDAENGSKALRHACALSVLGHAEYLVERGVLLSSENNQRPTLTAQFQPR